ncbi:MAG: hypothetical protein SF066_12885, partial [Thermoanaerobaculia bacterium]|nr:hypothetical protein [Thermoanaerobaculia bacterium]
YAGTSADVSRRAGFPWDLRPWAVYNRAMVTFLTLFLGLVVGGQELELTVAAPVVRVEVRLDEKPVGRLDGPPWKLAVDLGARLLPHRLSAVGFDAQGREVARAEQWVNLPRARAEATLSVTPGAGDQPASARLDFRHVTGEAPVRTRLELDGRELPHTDPTRVPLPPAAPEDAALLVAEVEFPDGVVARDERVWGGRYGTSQEVELTAVPVAAPRDGELTVADFTAHTADGHRPLSIVAVEHGALDLVVVAEPETRAVFGRLNTDAAFRRRRWGVASRWRLGPRDRIRFVSPHLERLPTGASPVEVFAVTQPLDAEDGNWPEILTGVALGITPSKTRLATAVAVAAREAAAGDRARAVLLVLAEPDRPDASRFAVDEVRAYLAALAVPLVVWHTDLTLASGVLEDRRPYSVETAWGRAVDVSSPRRFRQALLELQKLLDRQTVVFVAGSVLPGEITVSAASTP